MTDHVQSYDVGTIRELLLAAFTAEELHSLFQFASTRELRAVVNEFSPDDGLSAMAGKSVAYCEKHLLLGELLTEVKEANPRQYARLEPRLLVAQPSPARQRRAAEVRPAWGRAIPWPVLAGAGVLMVAAVIVVLVLIMGNGSTEGDGAGPEPTSASPEPTGATPEPDTRIRPKDGATMVLVPAGKFLMGSTDDYRYANSIEEPLHWVSVGAFWIDKTEITNAQFRKCVDAGVCTTPPSWDGEHYPDPYHPMEASWAQASDYATWVGGRLPTEAEWEKACRGVDGQIYPWGESFESTLVNYCDMHCRAAWKDTEGNDGYFYTAPVGTFPAGASPYGLLDMAGNVGEWTQPLPVVRGGDFSSEKSQVRCAARAEYESVDGYVRGFRVVLDP